MAWLSITLELEAGPAEALSEALLAAGADSVDLEPAGPRTRVRALAAPARDPARLVAQAARDAGIAPPLFLAEPLEDDDWVRRSQSQFPPIRAGERLWVVPSWHEAPDPAALVLRIDPGLAFGTGGHASTRLVLQFLERALAGGERVLDYGCGSGILAIAAARLGAGEVAAVDIDPLALATAAGNAGANGVRVTTALPEDLPPGTYDVVLANILAGPLIAMAPLLAARTRAGGRIALSGILSAQAAEVARAYAPDFETRIAAEEDVWALVEGVRR